MTLTEVAIRHRHKRRAEFLATDRLTAEIEERAMRERNQRRRAMLAKLEVDPKSWTGGGRELKRARRESSAVQSWL